MNLEKVIFGFFVVLAATLNFGFFIGPLNDPSVHNRYELFAAVAVNLIATVLKFGDRTQIGAVHLATSLVADLQLIAAAVVLVYANNVSRPASRRSRWPAWSRSRVGRCWPTSSRSCCSSSRPSPTDAGRTGDVLDGAGAERRRGARGDRAAVVGGRLPRAAPHAGRRSSCSSRSSRSASSGSRSSPAHRTGHLADGLLRRLLLHELHRQHDRLRRDPAGVQRRPADVGDPVDLPDGGGLGLRRRVAAVAAAVPTVQAGGGGATVPSLGHAGCASRSG